MEDVIKKSDAQLKNILDDLVDYKKHSSKKDSLIKELSNQKQQQQQQSASLIKTIGTKTGASLDSSTYSSAASSDSSTSSTASSISSYSSSSSSTSSSPSQSQSGSIESSHDLPNLINNNSTNNIRDVQNNDQQESGKLEMAETEDLGKKAEIVDISLVNPIDNTTRFKFSDSFLDNVTDTTDGSDITSFKANPTIPIEERKKFISALTQNSDKFDERNEFPLLSEETWKTKRDKRRKKPVEKEITARDIPGNIGDRTVEELENFIKSGTNGTTNYSNKTKNNSNNSKSKPQNNKIVAAKQPQTDRQRRTSQTMNQQQNNQQQKHQPPKPINQLQQSQQQLKSINQQQPQQPKPIIQQQQPKPVIQQHSKPFNIQQQQQVQPQGQQQPQSSMSSQNQYQQPPQPSKPSKPPRQQIQKPTKQEEKRNKSQDIESKPTKKVSQNKEENQQQPVIFADHIRVRDEDTSQYTFGFFDDKSNQKPQKFSAVVTASKIINTNQSSYTTNSRKQQIIQSEQFIRINNTKLKLKQLKPSLNSEILKKRRDDVDVNSFNYQQILKFISDSWRNTQLNKATIKQNH